MATSSFRKALARTSLLGLFFIAALVLVIVDIALKLKNDIVHAARNWTVLILAVAALVPLMRTGLGRMGGMELFTIVLLAILILVTIELIREVPDQFAWIPKKTASTIQIIIVVFITVPVISRILLPKGGFPAIISDRVTTK
jgi:hypothetical protein